jgi:hypothetical protein
MFTKELYPKKMNRKKFQEISKLREKEAKALLRAQCAHGAYYLAGYSIECALKACIAKQTNKHDFPNKDLAGKVHIHNLETLMKLASLEQHLQRDMSTNSALSINWATVKDWKETSRYSNNISTQEAKDMISACIARKNGILNWIRKKW